MKFRNSRLRVLQTESSLSGSFSAFHFKSAKLIVAAALVFGPFTLTVNSTRHQFNAHGGASASRSTKASANTRTSAWDSNSHPTQQRPGSTVAFVTSIKWGRQPGTTWYRLQIAGDENFTNVFYDGRVTGERYTISDLLPGYYYWRVAPANFQTGGFLRPVRFFVSGGVVTSAPFPNRPRAAARLATPVSNARGKGLQDVGL